MFHPRFDNPHHRIDQFGGNPFEPFGAARAHPAQLALARQTAEREARLEAERRRLELARQRTEEEHARRVALARQRKRLLRAAHAAATRVAAAYRGHRERHVRKALAALRDEARARADGALDAAFAEIELAIGAIECEHAATAFASRSEKAARVAGELLMRQLLRVDGLDLPAGAERARARRRAIVRGLNERMEQLEALADELKAAPPPSPSGVAGAAGEGCDQEEDDEEDEGDVQMVDAPADAEDDVAPSPAASAGTAPRDVELALLHQMVAELEEQNALLKSTLDAVRAASSDA